MIEIKNKNKCCGCAACVNACPKQCISMKEDEEGFVYPTVVLSSCINCGLCEKVCPILHPYKTRRPLNIYAAKAIDEGIRMSSSSGGMFMILARKVISENGIVFGARFNENFEVYHDYTETLEGLRYFQGSKYVQSSIGDSYKKAEFFLKKGRFVFFTGTPCQISGLKHYLRKEYDNLLTADIICHGVPSPKVWRNYLDELKEEARKGKNSVSSPLIPIIPESFVLEDGKPIIEHISFRDKSTGWKKFSFALTLAKATAAGKKNTVSLSSIHLDNSFMKGFLENYYIRPSCYHCPARMGKSLSDYTFADFWKLGKYFLDDDMGMSLLIINTPKGKKFFPYEDVKYKETNFDVLLDSNPSYFNSHLTPYKRKQFWKLYELNHHLQEVLEELTPSVIDIIPIKFLDIYRRLLLRFNLYKVKKNEK